MGLTKKKGMIPKKTSLLTSMVGLTGFEPAASASRTQRSTKLSHNPSCLTARDMLAQLVMVSSIQILYTSRHSNNLINLIYLKTTRSSALLSCRPGRLEQSRVSPDRQKVSVRSDRTMIGFPTSMPEQERSFGMQDFFVFHAWIARFLTRHPYQFRNLLSSSVRK